MTKGLCLENPIELLTHGLHQSPYFLVVTVYIWIMMASNVGRALNFEQESAKALSEKTRLCHLGRWPAKNYPTLSRRIHFMFAILSFLKRQLHHTRGRPLWQQKWKGSAIRTKRKTSLGVLCVADTSFNVFPPASDNWPYTDFRTNSLSEQVQWMQSWRRSREFESRFVFAFLCGAFHTSFSTMVINSKVIWIRVILPF